MQPVLRFFRGFLTLVFSASSLLLPYARSMSPAKIEAEKPNEVLLNFEVISDVHMSGSFFRKLALAIGLGDMTDSKTAVDALVMAGDVTDHGETKQFENLYDVLGSFDFTDHYIIASGNHDTWSDDGFETSRANFIDAYNTFTGAGIDKLYYSTEVKGYTFIVLGTEEDSGVEAVLSETQLNWLDVTLAGATAGGKPAFVICHQPIKDTHGLPEVWDEGDVGAQSDQLLAILKRYSNVFYISGHLHNGLNNSAVGPEVYDSVQTDGTLHMVNLPCFMYTVSSGNPLSGSGFQFEVYSDSVTIRARNYISSMWITDFEYSFQLD